MKESRWWDETMIGESEWIKEYFMLGFNFKFNHKCAWWRIILVKWGVS